MSVINRPLTSLQEGCWFKLICGASYHHLPSIRNLALVYALAGADCIDVAADPAVVEAVKSAFRAIPQVWKTPEAALRSDPFLSANLPFLMVSLSDGEDLHFRKATFDTTACPSDCQRPCESICPAAAIAFNDYQIGVIEDRCYGCGRCLPVCPLQHIETITRPTAIETIAPQLLSTVDAIEIHTQVGRYDSFMALWQVIQPYLSHLKLISISCPDDDAIVDYLWQLYEKIQPLPLPLIWQTDGRPMSGDIGKGTTHATLRYGKKVLQSGPPGFVQLAGGTNAYTALKLSELVPSTPVSLALLDRPTGKSAKSLKPSFGGVAYGSFARQLMSPLLDEGSSLTSCDAESVCEAIVDTNPYAFYPLETSPSQLNQAVKLARTLVAPLKATRCDRSALPQTFVSNSLTPLETR